MAAPLIQLLLEPPELLLLPPEEDELLELLEDIRGPSLLTRSTWNSVTSKPPS
jgi:hypothetical protein